MKKYKLKRITKNPKHGSKGIAIIEFMFVFFIFAFVIALMYGSWGVIHASILNSISARARTTAYIRNRSNIEFLRDYGSIGFILGNGYFNKNGRYFAVVAEEGSKQESFLPRKLLIDFLEPQTGNKQGFIGINPLERQAPPDVFRIGPNVGARIGNQKTGRVRLKQGYGICLNSSCN